MCIPKNTPEEKDAYAEIEHLTHHINEGDTSGLIFFKRGRTHLQLAHLAEAEADITAALRSPLRLPDNYWAAAHHVRSVARRRQGKYAQAMTDANITVEGRPDYPPYWTDRGFIWTCMRKPYKSLPDYEHSLTLADDFHLTYVYRGFTYFMLLNFSAALADYDHVIDLYGDMMGYGVFMNRGIIRLTTGDLTGAEADLTIAARKRFRLDARPLTYLGLSRALQNNLDEALADLDAGAQEGDNPMNRLTRLLIHRKRGDQEAFRNGMLAFAHWSPAGEAAGLLAATSFLANPLGAIPALMPLTS